ncbi:MAG TPA: hypothetical protein VJQ25_11170 [Nitrospira sp.]|nr:hypothetical protein [Nitrospira sp.]
MAGKWSAEQHRKFRETMKQKRKGQPKLSLIPLSSIPDKPVVHGRNRAVGYATPREQLAHELLFTINRLLDGDKK